MKTLLALRGAGNRGKTTSLCLLVELIKASFPDALFEEKSFKFDVTLVVTINGTRIGVETQGDPNSHLAASLKRFTELKCKVIVCACRSFGQTVDLVNATAQTSGYQVKWFEKARVANPRDQLAANRAVANELFNALRTAIGG